MLHACLPCRVLMHIWRVMTMSKKCNENAGEVDALFGQLAMQNAPFPLPYLPFQVGVPVSVSSRWRKPLLLAKAVSVRVYWCFDCDQRLWLCSAAAVGYSTHGVCYECPFMSSGLSIYPVALFQAYNLGNPRVLYELINYTPYSG